MLKYMLVLTEIIVFLPVSNYKQSRQTEGHCLGQNEYTFERKCSYSQYSRLQLQLLLCVVLHFFLLSQFGIPTGFRLVAGGVKK